MTTTWEGGVEAAAVAAVAPVTEGEEVWESGVDSETDPPEEERQTSGNRLKVTQLPV